MKVLLLGSGGRESALAWALDRSRSVDSLVVAPGNPGVAAFADTRKVDPTSHEDVVALADEMDADLVVVGPEAPLVVGIADVLRDKGRKVFGPGADAAKIEGSKSYAKELMTRAGVPTGASRTVSTLDDGLAALDDFGPPYVIKADGLAAGKGVAVTSDRAEAVEAIEARVVRGAFGDAGRHVVIEEFLDGEEASLIAFSDGTSVVPCEPAQDYKRAYDGDEGPNTGGMGSYSPVPACPAPVAKQIVEEVIQPMVAVLDRCGTPFVGALYAGLALTAAGPRVIEFNARFGDPETQALMPRLTSDFGEVALAAASGELKGVTLDWSPKACVGLVLASGGYPGEHRTGLEISGLEEASGREDVFVFHAGTRKEGQRVVTSGGRVLAVSALGDGYAEARKRAYEVAATIEFEGKHMRSDIAERAERSS